MKSATQINLPCIILWEARGRNEDTQVRRHLTRSYCQMPFMVVWEVDEEVLCGHQLHDGVSQELHSLVVAPGKEGAETDGQR